MILLICCKFSNIISFFFGDKRFAVEKIIIGELCMCKFCKLSLRPIHIPNTPENQFEEC